ncbi:unnamed protein product, partial [Ectocarpus sp. 6 AP-2014]
MSSAGLDTKLGRVTMTVKREESGPPEGEEEEYCTPHGTEEGADSGVSDVGCTDEERHGKGEVIAGRVDIPVKEEDEEKEQDEEEKARPGKRKLGGVSKAGRRCSVRPASSRQPNHAESPKTAPSKRQWKASAPGAKEQRGGGGTAATHTTASARGTHPQQLTSAMSRTTTRLSSTERPQARSTTTSPPEISDRKRREMQEKVDKIHDKTEVLVADLSDKDQWMDVRGYASGQRLGHFLGERLGNVLNSREVGDTVAGLIGSKFGVVVANYTLQDLEKVVERAVTAGVKGAISQTSTTGPTGRGQASSTIAGIAAVCFASIGTLPETNRSTTLDEAKHVAYKAALVSFLHEFPRQEADFRAKFCVSLTTKASETNKAIRTVFFSSLEQALDAMAAANYEDDDEEEEPADGRYDGIPARRRPCRVTLALLEDGLQKKWKEIALAKPGEFAARAFQTVRNHHDGRPLGEIFSTTEEIFDKMVMNHVMFST